LLNRAACPRGTAESTDLHEGRRVYERGRVFGTVIAHKAHGCGRRGSEYAGRRPLARHPGIILVRPDPRAQHQEGSRNGRGASQPHLVQLVAERSAPEGKVLEPPPLEKYHGSSTSGNFPTNLIPVKTMASMASYSQRRLALRVMIAAALSGVAAGFLPTLSAMRGAAARSGRAAPLATCVSAPVRMYAHAHAAPPAPVRGISGSPAGPWTRLKQVAIGLLAAVSLWCRSRGGRVGMTRKRPCYTCPRTRPAPAGRAGQERPARSRSRAADRPVLPSRSRAADRPVLPLPLRPVQLSLMAAPMFSCPARAAETVHRASALPPIHSQVWVE